MCRSIKNLFNFEPPATEEEVRAAAQQFIRKVSGSTHPSKSNEVVFEQAVDEVTAVVERLLDSLVTSAPVKNREEEAEKRRQQFAKRNVSR